MTEGSPSQLKKFSLPKPQLQGENRSMMQSGPHGGTPMVSKPGKQTVADYVCFSNGIKIKEEDNLELNPKFVPQHLIEEKIRMEFQGKDQHEIQAFVDDVKKQFATNLDPRMKKAPVDQNAGRPSSGRASGMKDKDGKKSTLGKRKQSEVIKNNQSNANLMPLQFAPTKLKGVSPIFKRTTRSQLEHLEAHESRTKINKHYNIRDEIIMKKPFCFVQICPPEHELRQLYEGDLCSKSSGMVCRHSNQRVISRLDKIKEIIELHKVQEARSMQMGTLNQQSSSNINLTTADGSMLQSPSGKTIGYGSPSELGGQSAPDSPKTGMSTMSPAPKHGSAFEDQLTMLNKGDRLIQEREEQLLQHHLKGMEENRKQQILKAAINLKQAFSQDLQEKRDSRIQDPEEQKLLAESYKILHMEEQKFKSVFVKSAEKNFINMQQDEPKTCRTRETLFDHEIKYRSQCDAQFDNINKMPDIASKYTKGPSAVFGSLADRDDKAIINKEYSGGTYYNTGLQAVKGQLKGNMRMDRQTDRPSIFGKDSEKADACYNDRDTAGHDNKACLRRNSNLGINWANMDRTRGRDNTMYHLSDGYNLKKPKNVNAFDHLVKLQSPAKLRMQPIYYDYTGKNPGAKLASQKNLSAAAQSVISGKLPTMASMQELSEEQNEGTTAMIQASEHYSEVEQPGSINKLMSGLNQTGLFSNTMTSQLLGIKDYGSMTLEEKMLSHQFAPKLAPTPGN